LRFPGNQLFTIHNQETGSENEWFLEKQGGLVELYDKLKIETSFYRPSGKSSLQTYLPKFLRNQQVILVHNVHTSESDILFAKTTNVGSRLFWCLCVNANHYIGGQLPDINLLLKHNCPIVLGTDSLASNHQLSILEEIHTIQQNFPAIERQTLLQWATHNGARALQMEGVLGSFEKDKQPGILLLDKEMKGVERLL
jgi:Cytosine deaminase and related metal-dependent hydrolases